MERQVKERTCDCCGKEARQPEKMIGGSAFGGWLKIEKSGGSTALTSLMQDKGPWHFCSENCAVEFLCNCDDRETVRVSPQIFGKEYFVREDGTTG